MREVTILGRAGQGAITVASIMATAGFLDGWHILAFPHFGAERMGAPMNAFVRLDRKPIRLRSAIVLPDDLILLDPTLLAFHKGEVIRKGGIIYYPEPVAPEALLSAVEAEVVTLPAFELAEKYLGTPKWAGIPILGAYSAHNRIFGLHALKEAIFSRFTKKIAEENYQSAEAGYFWVSQQLMGRGKK